MSAKRQATTNLNHDNWDREEEPEERGSFREATEDELSKRVIKKARRQITGNATGAADGAGTGASKSVFSGFAGFGKTATNSSSSQGATAASPFSFLAKLPTASASTSSSAITNKPTFSFGGAATVTTTTNADVSKLDKKTTESSDKSTTYYAKLKGLNLAVTDWIKTHVDKNPLCILTPVFKDYENYLKEIEEEEKNRTTATVESGNTSKSPEATTATSTSTTFGSFKFSAASTAGSSTALTSTSAEAKGTSSGNIFGNISKPVSSDTTKTNGFSFGLKTDDKSAAPTSSTSSSSALSGFSFGKPITSSTGSTDDKKPAATTGFSFTPGSTPFTFGNIQPPAALPTSTSNADEDEEEDQPPKVEFKQVVEDDAVFSKKCKVFVKKDGNFADRGIGTLYLKPVKDSEKTQLLVRADTNLGNILVNLILNEGIPAQRMGKNNVMLVCVPTPDVTKPTPMLLRVKTGEEADELLEAIEKYKK